MTTYTIGARVSCRARAAVFMAIGAMAMLASTAIAAPSITSLGILSDGTNSQAFGASADGSTATGQANTNVSTFSPGPQQRAFGWTSGGGIQNLGALPSGTESFGYAINGDGSAVTGYTRIASGDRAFLWTSGGIQNLGVAPGTISSVGYGVSGDGSIVAGAVNLGASFGFASHAARWTSGTGMVDLGTLPGGTTSTARGISNDGSAIVGYSGSSSGIRAFRWTQGGGFENLGLLAGNIKTDAYAVSNDGSVVVGVGYNTGSDNHVFRWTSASGMIDLGTIVGATSVYAYALNADGSAVVGKAFVSNGPVNSAATIWTADLGTIRLSDYLTSLGVDLTGWTLAEARGISADGSTIVGTGRLNGVDRAFIISGLPAIAGIPAPGAATLLGLGGIVAARRRRL